MALGKPLIPKMTAETTGVCRITADSIYNSRYPWHVGDQVATEYWDSYPYKAPTLKVYFNTGWYNVRTIIITRRFSEMNDVLRLTIRHRTDGSTTNVVYTYNLPVGQDITTIELPRTLVADTFDFSFTTTRNDVQITSIQLYEPLMEASVLKINNQYYKIQGTELVTINDFDESVNAFQTHGFEVKAITPTIMTAASKIGDFKILTMRGVE